MPDGAKQASLSTDSTHAATSRTVNPLFSESTTTLSIDGTSMRSESWYYAVVSQTARWYYAVVLGTTDTPARTEVKELQGPLSKRGGTLEHIL
jgi:hypothetical protein